MVSFVPQDPCSRNPVVNMQAVASPLRLPRGRSEAVVNRFVVFVFTNNDLEIVS